MCVCTFISVIYFIVTRSTTNLHFEKRINILQINIIRCKKFATTFFRLKNSNMALHQEKKSKHECCKITATCKIKYSGKI